MSNTSGSQALRFFRSVPVIIAIHTSLATIPVSIALLQPNVAGLLLIVGAGSLFWLVLRARLDQLHKGFVLAVIAAPTLFLNEFCITTSLENFGGSSGN